MGITALIMAGGKGTRMGLHEEKPLLKIGGKPMIEYVLRALENSEKVDAVVVAVSEHTHETAEFVRRLCVKVLKTPGIGYVSDMRYAVGKLDLDKVLTISADLPLITGEIIDKIVGRYRQSNKPALTVVVPVQTKERLGLGREHILEAGDQDFVPAGINMIDGRRIDEERLEEEIYVMNSDEIAVNVNTPQELRIAERLLAERPSGQISHPRQRQSSLSEI